MWRWSNEYNDDALESKIICQWPVARYDTDTSFCLCCCWWHVCKTRSSNQTQSVIQQLCTLCDLVHYTNSPDTDRSNVKTTKRFALSCLVLHRITVATQRVFFSKSSIQSIPLHVILILSLRKKDFPLSQMKIHFLAISEAKTAHDHFLNSKLELLLLLLLVLINVTHSDHRSLIFTITIIVVQ